MSGFLHYWYIPAIVAAIGAIMLIVEYVKEENRREAIRERMRYQQRLIEQRQDQEWRSLSQAERHAIAQRQLEPYRDEIDMIGRTLQLFIPDLKDKLLFIATGKKHADKTTHDIDLGEP